MILFRLAILNIKDESKVKHTGLKVICRRIKKGNIEKGALISLSLDYKIALSVSESRIKVKGIISNRLVCSFKESEA